MGRDGSVLGAVNSESRPLRGCNVYPLGAMRYQAQRTSNPKAQHPAELRHQRAAPEGGPKADLQTPGLADLIGFGQ